MTRQFSGNGAVFGVVCPSTAKLENKPTNPHFTPSPSGSSVGDWSTLDRRDGLVRLRRAQAPYVDPTWGSRAARPPDPLRPRRSLATLGFRLAGCSVAARTRLAGRCPCTPPGPPLAARPLEPPGPGRSAHRGPRPVGLLSRRCPLDPHRLSSLPLGWLGRSPLPAPRHSGGPLIGAPQESCPRPSPGGCSRRPQGPCPRLGPLGLGLPEGAAPRAPGQDLTRRSGSPSVAGGLVGAQPPRPPARGI